jgi:hypothetical protein
MQMDRPSAKIIIAAAIAAIIFLIIGLITRSEEMIAWLILAGIFAIAAISTGLYAD